MGAQKSLHQRSAQQQAHRRSPVWAEGVAARSRAPAKQSDFHRTPKALEDHAPDLARVQAAWVGAAIPPPPPPAPVSSVPPVLQEEAPGAAPVAGACMVSGRADATHPQLADESACLLHRQLALLPHDALNGLEDVPGHGDIPTDVDVASLLLQCFEHGLGQLLL